MTVKLGRRATAALIMAWSFAQVWPSVAPPQVLAADGKVTEFSILSGAPRAITAGPDGNLWFTIPSANKIAKITPAGTITEYAMQSPNRFPNVITAGPDGQLWFTEGGAIAIGKITLDGVITEFPLPPSHSGAAGITAGPDGNVWFTEVVGDQLTGLGRIGKITPTGAMTFFSLPPPTNVIMGGITAGPDGNLWFTNPGAFVARIGKITPAGAVTMYPVAPGTHCCPDLITAGPDGNVWFTELTSNNVGKITPDGVMTTYSIPTPGSNPGALTTAADGNLWFTESIANKIGRVSPVGSFTEVAIPTVNSGPFGITAGPDGTVWFTEVLASKVGSIVARGSLVVTGQSLSGFVDEALSGPVATLTDFSTTAQTIPANYSVTIDWGDGTTSPGVVTVSSPGHFLITGTHTYLLAATYTTSITVTKVDATTALGSGIAAIAKSHYRIEIKSWIPQPLVVDPVFPVPFRLSSLSDAELLPLLGCAPPVSTAPQHAVVRSHFEGDSHVGYDGSYRVLSRVEFDWDGQSIQNLLGPGGGLTYQSYGFTRRIISAVNRDWTCVQTGIADCCISPSSRTPSTFTLETSAKNPLLGLAPSIKSNLTGSFGGPGVLDLAWSVSFFPSHGLQVTKNGVVAYTQAINDASCLRTSQVLGPRGAGIIASGLLQSRDGTQLLLQSFKGVVGQNLPSLQCG